MVRAASSATLKGHLVAGTSQLTLLDSEVDEIDALLTEVTARHPAVDDTGFLLAAESLAHGLPVRVRAHLAACRAQERPLFAVAGWRVGDGTLGPTPGDWQAAWRNNGPGRAGPTHRHQVLLMLAASLVGDPFALSSAQEGHMVNHIVPIAGAEGHVSAASSTSVLTWHTEEAGFRFRPDHLAFACLRNPQQVPTTVGLASDLVLDPEVEQVLRQPLFGMPQVGSAGRVEYGPVLYGSADRPYLSADSVYMTPAPGDGSAAQALTALAAAVDAAARPFTARPGDLYFLDNHQVVHGRPAFVPRYDGSDRWLLRVKVARDLRGSRAYRGGAAARVIDFDQLG
ncbi:MAG TPA: TauD/TfdA family dioxygenase [Streptosporangiaceae bacterium]|nr:TauD/TfdA family dioxygenase [Streptosporangiaceae bacterium]